MFLEICKENANFFSLSLCEFLYQYFSVLWLHENHLDQFCLSTSDTQRAKPQSPSTGSQQLWQLVLQRDGARHLSDMTFEPINAWLSPVRMRFSFSLLISVGVHCDLQSQCVGVGGAVAAIRINYRLLPLSKVSCWWLWQQWLWAALSQCVSCSPPLLRFTLLVAPTAHKYPTEGNRVAGGTVIILMHCVCFNQMWLYFRMNSCY